MKRFFKFIAIILLLFFSAICFYYYANNETLPEGNEGIEADTLATKMLKALNYDAYENLEILEWSFRGKHFYKWYKKEHIVAVFWDNNKVILHTNEQEKSEVFINDIKTENKEILRNAITFFNNDSFWLVAPYKVFDTGTERRIVEYKSKKALLVTYTSGGSTPGDSYLWILDEKNVPVSYKMWTSIIPIGGVSATWSDWKNTEAGIKLPTHHKLSLFGMEISMGEVKGYNL